jgi:ABC-type multidrug transport system permease subunit
VIHFGLFLIRKFESSYAVLAYFLDISCLIAVLVVFGVIFNWYSSVPVWVLVIVGVMIYLFGLFTNMVRIRNDIKEMDELLQKRKGKNTDIAT